MSTRAHEPIDQLWPGDTMGPGSDVKRWSNLLLGKRLSRVGNLGLISDPAASQRKAARETKLKVKSPDHCI